MNSSQRMANDLQNFFHSDNKVQGIVKVELNLNQRQIVFTEFLFEICEISGEANRIISFSNGYQLVYCVWKDSSLGYYVEVRDASTSYEVLYKTPKTEIKAQLDCVGLNIV
jgi:hypothetical protein